MKLKSLALGLALQAITAAGAWACDGQTGSVIFEDNFSDDSGGWDVAAPGTQVKSPNLILLLNKNSTAWSVSNLTFNAGVGDYCADFVLPKAPAADNNAGFGITFWGTDYSNLYLALVLTSGNMQFYKRVGGAYNLIFTAPTPSLKTGDGAVNSLRVVASADQKLAISLNGAPIKTIRAQLPQGALRFGVFAETEKVSDSDVQVLVKDFKVTTGG